jgi:DNA-binding response OmpR family regulator
VIQVKQRSVLIVENEILIADHISRVVDDLGYRSLDPAFDVDQAIQLFNEHHPDLVIVDIRLRGVASGIDFVEWLRIKYTTPVIYITVFNDFATKHKAKATEALAYLTKPFSETELGFYIKSVFL